MRLSLMTLGDMMDDCVTGESFSAAARYRMTIDAAVLADQFGFHSINIGEHHSLDYAFSAPPVLLAAIAERTSRLKLSTAVALAANLDPLRLAEDYATVDVISGGRVEIVTGRGNFFEKTYDLFGQKPEESADRFAEAMTLLCQLWSGKPIHWSGQFRAPLDGALVRPEPVSSKSLPFWVGGGSSRETAELAGRLGLKLMLPSAFGRPDKFVAVADIYREAFAKAGHSHSAEVGACWHAWVDLDGARAHRRFEPRYKAYHAFSRDQIVSVHSNPPAYLFNPFDYHFLTTDGPAIVGGVAEFVDRISMLNELLGVDLNLLAMDMGGVPAGEYLEMVEILGNEVLPQLDLKVENAAA